MYHYLVRRLLTIIPLALVVLTLVFFIFRLVPGDPVRLMAGENATEADIKIMRETLGFDRPLTTQYFVYLSNAIRGDLGNSVIYGTPVIKEITGRMRYTLVLTGASMTVALVFGISAGVLSGLKAGGFVDRISSLISVFFLSIPNFWLGLMLIIAFSVNLKWLPSGGTKGFASLILPTIALSARLTAFIARFTRSSVLEVIRQDYIRTAHSKGLRPGVVAFKHALRNALIPVLTIAGLQLGALLGGSVVVESLFTWQGIGWLMMYGISSRDYVVVQGVTIIFAISYMLVNLFVDLLYAIVNPRIRFS